MEDKISKLLKELTLEEKAALCSGVSSWETTPISRLGIPSVFMSDGPHGVRKEQKKEGGIGNIFTESIPSTCFPPAVTLASTWDRELIKEIGGALADECLQLGVSTILGPGVNIKRNPLCGRNFEYFSEDPYLAGEIGAEYVKGVQEKGVGVSVKHYAVNSQEHKRMVASSEVDERTLREIYLPAFERVVKAAKPYTIMCSYNPVNGVYAAENRKLLTEILREEWGFDGIVISDWGAVNDRVKGVMAGLNLEMPSSNGECDADIVRAVQAGKLPEKELDKVVKEILEYAFKCYKTLEKTKGYKADYEKNHNLARRAAAEGSVLLKNQNSVLPLDFGKNFAVIGGLAKHLRSQGSGSSQLNPIKTVSFLEALDGQNIKYAYADGYTMESDRPDTVKIAEACKLAADKDFVIVFAGLTEDYESEGFDRTHMEIPASHIALIEELYNHNKNIIAVLTGGSPVEMPWLDKVKALLNVYLGGQAGGEATLDVLSGKVNPSGKLAETYPLKLSDVMSTNYFAKDVAEYRENVFVGYRYFDTANKPVLFPFGYGLSYTQFEYSDMALSSSEISEKDTLTVTLKVKNTGERAGAETVQLYVRDTVSTIFRPDKELKGFTKVKLLPGEEKTVEFKLDGRAFSFYNVNANGWTVEEGEFEILAASSSRDIRLSAKVFVNAKKREIPDYRDVAPVYYDMQKAAEIPLNQFEAVLGRSVNEHPAKKKGEYDFNTVIGELNNGAFARLFRFISKKASVKLLPKGASKVQKLMTVKGAMDMPIRNLYRMSGGAVSYEVGVSLLDVFNGKTFRGLAGVIRGATKKQPSKREKYK